MKRAWLIFAQVVAIFAIIFKLIDLTPFPLFDHNGTTLMCADSKTQTAVAKALSTAIGKPTAILNTRMVNRYLFKDGTSVDSLNPAPSFGPMYQITSLKSVALDLFSLKSPSNVAYSIVESLEMQGYETQVVMQPDIDVPDGSTILILSSAFEEGPDRPGFGLIVRKHPLRIGGPQPAFFFLTGWPQPKQGEKQ